MIKMKLKTGNWKNQNTRGFDAVLRAKGTNVIIGHAFENHYSKHTRVIFRFGSVSGSFIEIPYTEDFNIIHKEWEKLEQEFIEKYFI